MSILETMETVPATESVNTASVTEQPTLRESVNTAIKNYFDSLDGQTPSELYDMVLAEIEAPLLERVMDYTRGNQTKAAIILGLNRGTLRKKLKIYGLN
ncbi:DNA-binding protein Fis [Pleionea mediterranea]|jgi:Fis family transcriptional regulator|uniref:Putative Fis-like DNA-binding protein n=2 Tax=Pleionea mediterranea TaxID=523701 RepID=A0A316FZK9_9GAMM|nr:DNA-binding protein Fis [Pleionea mediterranea]